MSKKDFVSGLTTITLIAFTLLPLCSLAANEIVAAPTLDSRAMNACAAAAQPDVNAIDIPEIAARLRKPDSRVVDKDWSGQNLSGKSFSSKALINVKMKNAILRDADLSDAIICGSDLSDADLTGAHLDRTVFAAYTQLDGANFTKVSAREANFADVSGAIRIDGADLRGASTLCDELPRCIGSQIEFSSIAGADLRGAAIGSFCCQISGVASAKLDGMATHLGLSFDGFPYFDLQQLAFGAGDAGRITFLPAYGYSGTQTTFTGGELRQLASLLVRMRITSAHPSFDCAHAGSEVEKAVCADPELAALDAGLSWLWQRVPHTMQELEIQRKWVGARATCPSKDYASSPDAISFGSADLRGCIGIAYAERIRALAAKSSSTLVGSGRYTTDAPLELPQDPSSELAQKFIMARGYRYDEIDVENWGHGGGRIAGNGLWANGHECGLEASEVETRRTGSKVRIDDNPKSPDDQYSVSFVITPQVIVRAGGDKQFQCGARGGWSDIYFRQPNDLISHASPLHDAH
jgi:uncharacterized protein YjbI with pentapeptide repeats